MPPPERVDDFRFHFASSPDGKTLVTQKQGEYVQLRDAATGAELHALGWHKDGAVSAFTPDGRTLLTGDGVGRIRTWDAHTGEPIPSDAARWRSLISLAWSPDSRTPLSGCKGGMVRLWDASSGKEVRGFEQPDYSPWTPVAFSPDGNLAATAGHISIRIWEVKTGRLLYEHQDMNMINASVLMFAPDGRTLFIASHRAGFHRWDFASGKKCAPLGDAALSWSAALSPDGKTLLSSNGHGAVCLWEAAGGQALRRLESHADEVYDAVFSRDGRVIASVGNDRTIRLWDATTGKESRHWTAIFGPSLSFSADGKHLASASGRTIKLWETDTCGEVVSLAGHRGRVSRVAFSPDGKRLASLSDDGTILIWDAERLLESRRTSRASLTPDELETRWAELGDADAYVADEAETVLIGAGNQTVALARDRLHAPPVEPRHLAVIAKLGNDSFDVRERASRELESFGTAAEPALRRAFKENPDPEVRQRVQILLARLDHVYPPEERTRDLRTLGVLERIGGPETRKVLERLANGPVESPLAREAKACLDRLSGRPPTP